jgi:hypothetical protein
MNQLTAIASMTSLMFAAGCGKEERDKVAAKVVDDASFEMAKDGLTEIKGKLKRGESVEVVCATSESFASELSSAEGKKIAAELNQLCNYEAQVVAARAAVADVEKAAADMGEDEEPDECYNECYGRWSRALSTLKEKFAGKPIIAELEGRWTAICSPQE